MERVKELKIKASNVLVPNNILLRQDAFGREIGILVKPEDESDEEHWKAIYIYKSDLSEFIKELFKFFLEISKTAESVLLYGELTNAYIEHMKKTGSV